jgi:hypothetical protein
MAKTKPEKQKKPDEAPADVPAGQLKSKRVAQLDEHGFFIGMTDADESPLEPGVFLMPAGCVDSEPPAVEAEDKAARWNGSAFVVINKPKRRQEPAALEKLQAFLKDNPDVAALLDSNNGGADV